MARRGMTGQLNMFDLIHSLENSTPGEVEMVSLVPVYDEEPEIEVEPEIKAEPETVVEPEMVVEPETVVELEVEEEPEVEEGSETEVEPEVDETPQLVTADLQVAMSRRYECEGEMVEIAYINYNKVRISRGNKKPEIIEFASTKEAVDYYVEKILELEVDE